VRVCRLNLQYFPRAKWTKFGATETGIWTTKTGIWTEDCELDNSYVKISAQLIGRAFKNTKIEADKQGGPISSL